VCPVGTPAIGKWGRRASGRALCGPSHGPEWTLRQIRTKITHVKFCALPRNRIYGPGSKKHIFRPRCSSKQVGDVFKCIRFFFVASNLHMGIIESHCTINRIQPFGGFSMFREVFFARPSGITHFRKVPPKTNLDINMVTL